MIQCLGTIELWILLLSLGSPWWVIFLQPHQSENLPYTCPSNTQWSSWCEKMDHWTGVQQEEFDSKADARYPQKRTFLEQHQSPETYKGWVSQGCPPPQKYMSPRHMAFFSCNPGCLVLQMKGASRSTARIQIDEVNKGKINESLSNIQRQSLL